MYEVVLPRRPEESGAIDRPDVFHRHPVPTLHHGEIPQTCKEGLHVVGNANAKCFVYRVCHAILDL